MARDLNDVPSSFDGASPGSDGWDSTCEELVFTGPPVDTADEDDVADPAYEHFDVEDPPEEYSLDMHADVADDEDEEEDDASLLDADIDDLDDEEDDEEDDEDDDLYDLDDEDDDDEEDAIEEVV